jgi:tetratricopeptide (TPR) repeat protein
MIVTRERPDPYGPKRKVIPSSAVVADTGTPSGNRTELMTAALRAMAHEQPKEARIYLEALASAESLERRDPKAVDALAYLSSVLWNLGQAESAIDAAARALELGPERFAPNQKAGEMSLRLGQVDLAEAQFLTALRASEPGTADARAAETCLREARQRASRGIRHEARAPRLSGWMDRLLPGRRRHPKSGAVTTG